ncbi:hypothetical protein VTK26DRAFT_4373 [Humicola hyalothermophila]
MPPHGIDTYYNSWHRQIVITGSSFHNSHAYRPPRELKILIPAATIVMSGNQQSPFSSSSYRSEQSCRVCLTTGATRHNHIVVLYSRHNLSPNANRPTRSPNVVLYTKQPLYFAPLLTPSFPFPSLITTPPPFTILSCSFLTEPLPSTSSALRPLPCSQHSPPPKTYS